jgi:hypothetical protein
MATYEVIPICRPAIRGKLGKFTHTVSVHIATPFCVDDPEIEIPLDVHRTGVPIYTQTPQLGITLRFLQIGQAQSSVVNTKVQIVQVMQMAAVNNNANATTPMTLFPAIATPGEALPTALESVEGLISQLQQGNQWVESYVLNEWLTYGDKQALITKFHYFQMIFHCIRIVCIP